VLERPFEVSCEERRVPGVLWTPIVKPGHRPLVLAAHGFTMSKRALFPLTLAHDLVLRLGVAVAAIDAPAERADDQARALEDDGFTGAGIGGAEAGSGVVVEA
jgi:hypothetical protein